MKQIELECSYCHTFVSLHEFTGACEACGETIVEARYDTPADISAWIETIQKRPTSLWRYHEVLPIYDTGNIISMGEGLTPLIKSKALAESLGLKHLYFKDERQGPTGSFKDRQASVAISALYEKGIKEVVVASTGNVAIAYSAYGARAGIKTWAFFPELAPDDKMRESALYGSEIIKTTGTYDQTKALAASFAHTKNIFLDRGIKSVAAIEAMKTMAYEIAEQLGEAMGDGIWRSPDWFLQGVSGGMGPIGVGKGFREMQDMGLVDSLPAFGLIQSEGCAPMVQAFKNGQRVATPIDDSKTVIATLATGNPGRAYELLYDYVQVNGGHFESATDEEAFRAILILAKKEGISVEPAVGVTIAGLIRMAKNGIIKPDDIVVVNCSGHTLPVEKRILGDQWQREVDLTNAGNTNQVPKDDILSTVSNMQRNLKRVVIIEDNEDAARLISRLLEAHGNCEVYLAQNGNRGLKLIDKVMPDLIITDLMMPEVDGFMVIESLRANQNLRSIPIVVVSAKELTVAERNFLSENTIAVLQKGSIIDDGFIEALIEKLG